MNTKKEDVITPHPLDQEVEARTRTGYWGHQCPRPVVTTAAKLQAAAKVAAKDAGGVYGD